MVPTAFVSDCVALGCVVDDSLALPLPLWEFVSVTEADVDPVCVAVTDMEREVEALRVGLTVADAYPVAEGSIDDDGVCDVDRDGEDDKLGHCDVETTGVDERESELETVEHVEADGLRLADVVGETERDREPVTVPRPFVVDGVALAQTEADALPQVLPVGVVDSDAENDGDPLGVIDTELEREDAALRDGLPDTDALPELEGGRVIVLVIAAVRVGDDETLYETDDDTEGVEDSEPEIVADSQALDENEELVVVV